MTIAAGSYTWDQYLNELQIYRKAMAETPEKYVFVRSTRDIEAAHIQGKTAVIWNTQTSTILDGDLKKVALLKELGIASIILSYNDLFRAGSGSLAEFNGSTVGVTPWGLSIIDEMVKYSNEDIAKIYGGNKMRVYQQVWEGVPPEQFAKDYEDRVRLRNELRERFQAR